MKNQPRDTWLTHDADAEELDNICDKCGGFLAVSVDPEGYTVYCTECPPKHQTKTKNGTDNNTHPQH